MQSRLTLLLLAIACLVLQACNSPKTHQPATAPPGSAAAEAPKMTTMVVHLPNKQPEKVWEVEIANTMTVGELMYALKDAQFQFTDTLYPGMGHLVTSVAGFKNAGGEGEYWQFCIDNLASDRGVDEKTVAPGQHVDWHYAKYGELPCKKIGE